MSANSPGEKLRSAVSLHVPLLLVQSVLNAPNSASFPVAEEKNRSCRLLILTVLAESAHEPRTAVTRPVVFVTHATVLTSGTGFHAAGTPETLHTHCKETIVDDIIDLMRNHTCLLEAKLMKNLFALTVLTVCSRCSRRTVASSSRFVTWGAGAVTRMNAATSKPSVWTV